ncbi:hypothetical protein [Paenibacillus taichungensis]|uniref:hypothetical protein n=1 Tax=Paenibacillus taichungensis TaxID=484184 RepID=UPI0039A01D24
MKSTPKKPEVKEETQEQEIVFNEEYARKFTQVLFNTMNNPSMISPIWQNQILKDMNMSPAKFNRDSVKKMLADPKNHERELKDLSQYLFNFIMQFKKLVIYMSEILTYDHYLEPTNADAEDMKSKAFKKSYSKALQWIEDFDLVSELHKVAEGMILEDAKYYYLRESENGIRLQELPSNYCKIWSRNDLGYQYAFNMSYFLNPGVNLDDFHPDFREYYNNFIGEKEHSKKKSGYETGQYSFWQKLDPAKAWTFKFDDNRAGISPPLMGLFLDSIEIVNYKELLKTKTSLDVWKLLVNKIPMHKDGAGKSGKQKDDFAIMADTAGQFSALMQAAVPQGVKVVTTPLETEALDFKQADSKDSIVGLGNSEFWETSGTSPVLFGEKQLNGSGLAASIKTDEMFVYRIYRQFERFINFQLRQTTGKYRFKCHLEGTRFDQQERFDRAIKAAQYGAPVTYVATAMGKTPQEFSNLINLEDSIDLKDRMRPLSSSHVQSGNEVGAPQKSNLTDSGEKTRDNDSNLDI